MNKIVTIILSSVLALPLFGYDFPEQYRLLIGTADSLTGIKKYEAAACTYNEAANTSNGQMETYDRQKAAVAWTLANYPDSAFRHLGTLAADNKFSDYSAIATNANLLPLHSDRRWTPLLNKIRKNREEANAGYELSCSGSTDKTAETKPDIEIRSYDLDVYIDVVKKTVRVKGHLAIDTRNLDSSILTLWGQTKINAIKCGNEPVPYTFDTLSSTPSLFIWNGKPLTIHFQQNKQTKKKLYFDYECDMGSLSSWATAFTENWIELGFYTAWYPLNMNNMNFTSKLRIHIDPAYTVNGSGTVRKKKKYWEMEHKWKTFDNVIIAAKNLESEKCRLDRTTVEILYSNFPKNDLDSVATVFHDVLSLYKSLYGNTGNDSECSKFVLSSAYGRGGYSRKNFISMISDRFEQYLVTGIAHEVAHFWWNGANPETWHDWLNEAFAEYSNLLFLREKMGKTMYDAYIDAYRVNASHSCPIWDLDRTSPGAYTSLYEKGAVLLHDLKERIGEEQFLRFTRKLLHSGLKTTYDFLFLLQKDYGTENRKWFEEKLKAENYK